MTNCVSAFKYIELIDLDEIKAHLNWAQRSNSGLNNKIISFSFFYEFFGQKFGLKKREIRVLLRLLEERGDIKRVPKRGVKLKA